MSDSRDDRAPDFESGGVGDVNLSEVPSELAILPLRDTILFPHAILPLNEESLLGPHQLPLVLLGGSLECRGIGGDEV